MTKYSAISIGPIIATINMARKPRELWAASYLFSLLMKCIVTELQKKGGIISPILPSDIRKDVGLCPDRVYVKREVEIEEIDAAINSFTAITKLSEETVREYFNIMTTTTEQETDAEAIKELNSCLNYIELFNRAVDSRAEDEVGKLIRIKENSPLFFEALNSKKKRVDTIDEIARNGRDNAKESYNNYVCVVQADGDNMGRIITSAATDADKIRAISCALAAFGGEAVNAIENYSQYNLPIYAGGDDLLFIVPVVGDKGNIFDLIKEIDGLYEKVKAVANQPDGLSTSMSYGIAICYHKYPLYEALGSAREQLFSFAKNVEKKNALAIDLRKHSGGAFAMRFSKSDDPMYEAIEKVIEASGVEGSLVSAVSHKIRNNEGLLELWLGKEGQEERNLNFFRKYVEYNDATDKPDNEQIYKKATLGLLNAIKCSPKDNRKAEVEAIIKSLYGILRIAKFISGEKGESND